MKDVEDAIQYLKDKHEEESELAIRMKLPGTEPQSFGLQCRYAGYNQAIIDLEQLVKLKKFEQLEKEKKNENCR